ncbi:hypothetical protein A2U01_0093079, partial [Trifolium medium]|nr:hypothetical protein [Trifolium medium]
PAEVKLTRTDEEELIRKPIWAWGSEAHNKVQLGCGGGAHGEAELGLLKWSL